MFAVEKTVYFVSDLHLGLGEKKEEEFKEKLFVSFLNSLNPETSRLFIVGDLFDYWFEYRRVIQKGYYRTFTAIKNFTEQGGTVHYLIGNHDFLHRDFFEADLKVNLIRDNLEATFSGKKFFIAHGDGMLKNDTGYKILKKILNNKFLQAIYSLIHPDLGIWIASSASKTSRKYTTQKDYGFADGLLNVAQEKIEAGFDYVVFGHSHVKQFVKHQNGFYINLGSWLDNPCYGKFENGNFEIIDLKP